MKKILFIILIAFSCSLTITAQQGYKAITVYSGYTWNKGVDNYISIDLPNKFFTSFEFYGNVFLSEEENNYIGGMAYKPSLYRGVNNFLRAKIGAGLGTSIDKFIFNGIVGFEYVYAVSPTIDFMLIPQGGFYFNSVHKWRFSTLGGLRFNF